MGLLLQCHIDCSERNKYIDEIVGKAIRCKGCSLCCSYSSAFVLSHEISQLRSLGVPLHKIDGIHFIVPLPNGKCPELNSENQCRIYEDRPTACRLFPFYLMNRPALRNEWALFQFCPEENRSLKEVHGSPSINILRMMVFELEKRFSHDEIREMLQSDAAIANRDLLEVGGDRFVTIMACQKE